MHMIFQREKMVVAQDKKVARKYLNISQKKKQTFLKDFKSSSILITN